MEIRKIAAALLVGAALLTACGNPDSPGTRGIAEGERIVHTKGIAEGSR